MRTLILSGAVALPLLAAALVQPSITISLRPDQVTNGSLARGTVSLSTPVLTATDVSLTSSNPTVVKVPPTVRLVAGSQSGTFTVSTTSGTGGCSIVAATLGKSRVSAPMFVNPPTLLPLNPSLPVLVSLSVPASIVGGQSGSGSASESDPVGPVRQHQITLTSSNPAVASVPTSVVTPLITPENLVSGDRSAKFTITTTSVSIPTCAIIKASGSMGSVQRLIRILPQ